MTLPLAADVALRSVRPAVLVLSAASLLLAGVSSACGADSSNAAQVRCRVEDGRLTVSVGDRPVLTYHLHSLPTPEGIDDVYRSSGFLHPVQTPAGRTVTAAYPADHAHQHGIFFAWVKTEFEGRDVDFWNQAGLTGTVRHDELLGTHGGDESGGFSVRRLFVDRSAPDGEVPVLEEEWDVTVHSDTDRFVFDLVSRQRCASDSPLTIKEYHYGGMAFRGTTEWLNQPEHDFLTSEGKTRADGNHTRPRWVVAHGLVAGEPAAVTVLSHPGNFRAPQPVRLHPSKPYFVFAPEVLGEFQIAPGEVYVSRYRYVLADRVPTASDVDQWYADYVKRR